MIGSFSNFKDDLQWKTTSNGRRPPIEDDLQWETTFNGRQPPMEDDLQWKTNSFKKNNFIA